MTGERAAAAIHSAILKNDARSGGPGRSHHIQVKIDQIAVGAGVALSAADAVRVMAGRAAGPSADHVHVMQCKAFVAEYALPFMAAIA